MLDGKANARVVDLALRRALELSRAPDWCKRLPDLGAGWVTVEALAISVLCALAAKNVREAIAAAVNPGGDSDSTGTIAGNIVGTLHGPEPLPGEWVDQVELRDVIRTLAEDLAAVADRRADRTQMVERMWDRYPGW